MVAQSRIVEPEGYHTSEHRDESAAELLSGAAQFNGVCGGTALSDFALPCLEEHISELDALCRVEVERHSETRRTEDPTAKKTKANLKEKRRR